VMDRLVYACEGQVRELENSFTIVVTLDIMFREDGESQDQMCFHHLLLNIRDAIQIVQEWKLLMSCINSSLDSSTKESSNKAIHCFATNENVNNHNTHFLASLNYPIA
jgi:hypothetical protein